MGRGSLGRRWGWWGGWGRRRRRRRRFAFREARRRIIIITTRTSGPIVMRSPHESGGLIAPRTGAIIPIPMAISQTRRRTPRRRTRLARHRPAFPASSLQQQQQQQIVDLASLDTTIGIARRPQLQVLPRRLRSISCIISAVAATTTRTILRHPRLRLRIPRHLHPIPSVLSVTLPPPPHLQTRLPPGSAPPRTVPRRRRASPTRTRTGAAPQARIPSLWTSRSPGTRPSTRSKTWAWMRGVRRRIFIRFRGLWAGGGRGWAGGKEGDGGEEGGQ